MDGSVEVRPRYADPDMRVEQRDSATAQVVPAAAQTTLVASKGILTSMYENKMIVIIIILSILVIAFIAYVVYNKSDDDSGGSKVSVSTQGQPSQQSQNQPQQTPAPRAETAPVVPTAQPKVNKTAIAALLAKSKNGGKAPEPEALIQTQSATKAQSNEDTGSKTEEEIMHLMEDEPTDETNDSQDMREDVQEPDIEQETDPQQVQDETDDTQQTPANNNQKGMCVVLVPPGRQCRNKACSNGKCKRHGG